MILRAIRCISINKCTSSSDVLLCSTLRHLLRINRPEFVLSCLLCVDFGSDNKICQHNIRTGIESRMQKRRGIWYADLGAVVSGVARGGAIDMLVVDRVGKRGGCPVFLKQVSKMT